MCCKFSSIIATHYTPSYNVKPQSTKNLSQTFNENNGNINEVCNKTISYTTDQ